MAYAAIPNADVDADSPLTESLITQLRDNTTQVKDEFDIEHNFDGTIADGTHVLAALVSAGNIKTLIQSGTTTSATFTIVDADFAAGTWIAFGFIRNITDAVNHSFVPLIFDEDVVTLDGQATVNDNEGTVGEFKYLPASNTIELDRNSTASRNIIRMIVAIQVGA